MLRFDVFLYRSLKMYSTNIFLHFVTENLMPAVLPTRRTCQTIPRYFPTRHGVASTDGDSAVQADAVMSLTKACLGSEMNGGQRLHWCARKKVYTHGQSRDNPIYNRSNLQQDEFESTNIMVYIMTEILIIVLLSGGVCCSKGCCRRFGRILENVDALKSSTTSSLKRCR